jgi:hypothetical protein
MVSIAITAARIGTDKAVELNFLRKLTSEAISYCQGWSRLRTEAYRRRREIWISTNELDLHKYLYDTNIFVEITSHTDWTQGWAAKAGNIGIEEGEGRWQMRSGA